MRTHRIRRTSAALVAATATALALLTSAPAQAATPATVRAGSTVTLVAGSQDCTITSGGSTKSIKVSAPRSGSKRFTAATSAKATAHSTLDQRDKVSLSGAGRLDGEVSSVAGSFAGLRATASPSALVRPALGSTSCQPVSQVISSAIVTVHVGRRGKVVLTASSSAGGITSATMLRGPVVDGSGTGVASQKSGTWSVTYPVRPGTYTIAIGLVSQAAKTAPFFSYDQSAKASFSATFKAS